VLSGIAQNGESESARVAAANILLDRGWGKPPQEHAAEGGGEIRVIIRNITAEMAQERRPLQIEAVPNQTCETDDDE
jgi:hypothetical protein